MPETIEKLRPDRDLQCYFERPSAIAALSEASPSGYVVSGCWRQQFDWAVIEWNRDNVFEHPALRNLPDGDLSGLVLSYEEIRFNCIPLDSDLFPTVDWPYLRVWAGSDGTEALYKVRLRDYAVAIEGVYQNPSAQFTLNGTLTVGDYVSLAWLNEHYTYQIIEGDTAESSIQAIVDSINAFSQTATASRSGNTIQLSYHGTGQAPESSTIGSNGNRIGVRALVGGAKTESWDPPAQTLNGGASPSKWRITLSFNNLRDTEDRVIPTSAVRKMRWTYSADLQSGSFQRSDYEVRVSNWTVTGSNRNYSVAGPGSRRIEDDSPEAQFAGPWNRSKGNFSGGTIHYTTSSSAAVTCHYTSGQNHRLMLGTRYTFNGAQVQVTVDASAPITHNLLIPGEDVLARIPILDLGPGAHSVTVAHTGPAGGYFYFDFIELAVPSSTLPEFPLNQKVTLATDWDTDHSIAIAPERTAWLIKKLGFHGRANHYVGALWFYQLHRPGHSYASATVDFSGTPEFSAITELKLNRVGDPAEAAAVIPYLNLMGDTAETVTEAFAMELNRGYTAVRAEASGSRLTIYARAMGEDGNILTITASPTVGPFTALVSSSTLTGGTNGDWRTDVAALPRLNRAVIDWSRAFYRTLKGYGIDCAAAFSMELQHGDPSPLAGIAQRYPSGNAALLNTPALQTNFSAVSIEFWKHVYDEMAGLLSSAGIQPYLQFGEVQWWYFPSDGSGMPFYDADTQDEFRSQFGRDMAVFTTNNADPSIYQQEVAFLAQKIGSFTSQVVSFVRQNHPDCRFEVLYPTDVNDTSFNTQINYPVHWTSNNLECLKTESFTYTLIRDLNKCRGTIEHGEQRGFLRSGRSFLVGIGDSTTLWHKEVNLAQAAAVESIVLFAVDQFCLIGYPVPLRQGTRRSIYLA